MIHTQNWPEGRNVASASWNDETGDLDITFVRGAKYRYFDVNSTTWEKFKAAESGGSFFTYNIKGDFKFKRL